MRSHHEVETTYQPDEDTAVPDLVELAGVEDLRAEPTVHLDATYYDTDDLALLRAGVSLRRRTGGADEGWHLKVPAGDDGRDEIQLPLSRARSLPPKPLRDLVAGWTRGRPLTVVATVTTRREPVLLLATDDVVLAEFVDDRVTGTTPDGGQVRWREWELELVHGTPELLASADERFAAYGVDRARVGRKVARVLADRLPTAPRVRRPKPGKPVARLVHLRLLDLVAELARHDVTARRGKDRGVHQMRVACRRLRALLATFRPVLDREVTDPIRDELWWLAHQLGPARDAAIVHERLRGLLDDEPLVLGPVRTRLRATCRGRGWPEVHAALNSQRYRALRDRLDGLAADPPWTERADEPARDLGQRLMRRERKRFRKRLRAATEAPTGTAEADRAWHDARKAAKRLRYAAETIAPVAGKTARRQVKRSKRVTSQLGELQDTVVARAELVALAHAAQAAGEPSFTYGRLHARVEARAARLITRCRASRGAR